MHNELNPTAHSEDADTLGETPPQEIKIKIS